MPGWLARSSPVEPSQDVPTLNTPEGTATDCITSPKALRFPGFLDGLTTTVVSASQRRGHFQVISSNGDSRGNHPYDASGHASE